MATSKTASQTYAGEYAAVFDAACRAAGLVGMTVTRADPSTGVITLSSSMTFTSWGENVVLQVGQLGPGAVQVSVRSDLKFGLVDWGKNAKNVNQLLGTIDVALHQPAAGQPQVGVPQQAMPQQAMPQQAAAPAGGWHPDPSGRHQYRYWDGTAWSAQVSDGGVVSTDPL